MTQHVDIKIFGDVQMVLFRVSAQEKAAVFNIVGFVRNEPDGSLYIEAEGDEEALSRFVDWVKKGPVLAKIEKVEVNTGEIKKYKDFTIQ